MKPDRHDLLILRYLDNTASPEELAALDELLQTDEQARLTMREMAVQAVAMADFARERMITSSPPNPGSPAKQRTRRLGRWFLVAACLALAVGGMTLLATIQSRETVTIGHLSGAVSFATDGGGARSELKAGTRVPAGTITVEGAASSVQLSFDDGNLYTLVGDSELSVSTGEQKRLSLHRGTLGADVRPQATERPMIIHTPTADVKAVETRCLVTAQRDETRLSVESGTARMQRLADSSVIEVSHGQESVASLGTATKLESRRLPVAPPTFSQTFEAPPTSQSWHGTWLPPEMTTPGRLHCVPDFSYLKADGTPVAAYTVNLRDNSASIVTVAPQSVLRLRFRAAGSNHVLALIGLHYPQGGFAANFTTVIKPGQGASDGTGWRVFEAPLSSMESKFPNCTNVPIDSRVFLIYLAAYSPKANLEVADVSITPPDAK